MAVNNRIQVIRSSRASLDAQAAASGLLPGELYKVTDETPNKLCVGTAVNAYVEIDSPSSIQTLTNKTLDSFTNTVNADELHIQVRNSSGVTILKGTPVYVSGYNFGIELVEVAPADASSSATMPAIGLMEYDLPTNTSGSVDVSGRISGVDTSAFSVGSQGVLYVSETAGALTNVAPVEPALTQQIAIVLRSHASLGVLEVSTNAIATPTGGTAVTAWPAAGTVVGQRATINGVLLEWNGLWWTPVRGDPSKWLSLRDERLIAANPTLQGTVGNSVIGTGTFASATPPAGRIGVTTMASGTTAVSTAMHASSFLAFVSGSDNRLMWEADIMIPVLSTTQQTFIIACGFINSNTVETTNGYYFHYTHTGGGSSNFRAKTAKASTRTDTDTGITPVAGTWYRLRVEVDETTGLSYFYIDNVLVATNPNTNKPLTGVTFGMGVGLISTGGTTSKLLWLDRMALDRVEIA